MASFKTSDGCNIAYQLHLSGKPGAPRLALIHSLAVTEKRGVFKSWTVLLAIAAFSLSMLGAFIVRSGVITSVHAFAIDPERGMDRLIVRPHGERRFDLPGNAKRIVMPSRGVEYTVVNGAVTWDQGKLTEAKAGRVLRG